jgi:hypothetical protein
MVRFAFASLAAMSLALVALAGCEKDKPTCMQGQMYDEASGQCMAQQPMCPQGTMWNGAQCAPAGGGCPAGQMWNGSACVAGGGGGTQCPAGQTWNGSACVAGGGGGVIPGVGGGSCPPAQALDPMAGAAATQGLNLLAQQNAPGAKAVGSPLAGNFQAGQCLETQVMLNPGKCYTAIATGAGPSEVDVQLQLPLPPPGNQTIAQDNGSGPLAVLGKSPDCFKNPSPFAAPMKLVLKVSGGQGMAAAQLYEK